MTEVSRDFKGIWIPREIWLHEGLSHQEKCLWAEIHSLYNPEKGGCFASNEYLEKFFGVKERRLQEMFHNLKEKGLLVQVSFNGRERVLKAINPEQDSDRRTSDPQKSAGQTCAKMHPSDAEKCGSPNIYRTKNISKNNDVGKTQKKNVVVPLFIQEIEGITEEDKKILSRYPEDHVKAAIEYSKHVPAIGSKIQQLMYFSALSKPVKVNKNNSKQLHDELISWEKLNESDCCSLIIEKDSITFDHSGQGKEKPIIKFSEEGSRKKIAELMQKYKFYPKK